MWWREFRGGHKEPRTWLKQYHFESRGNTGDRYLLSFILEPIWHSLSVSCDKNLSFVLKPVNLFYRLKMLQPSCLHYGSKFLTHPSWWWQRDKPFAFLFCFTLSQERLRNSIPVPNEELVFKHISAYLRALLLRNWEKICVHIRRIKMMLFLLSFCGIFTVGVELIFSCRSALLSLEEQRQGQAAVFPRTVRDFAHWAFGGVWCAGMGVRDPLVSDRLVPLAVAPLRLVAATIPRAATGTLVGPCCLRCADGWGGRSREEWGATAL